MIRHLQMWSSKKKADTSIQGLPFYIRKDTFLKADGKWKAAYILSAFLVIAMLCMIFCFSAADATHSSHLSEGVCIRLVREVSSVFPEQFPKERMLKIAAIIELPIRKCAHFSEYAVLSITINLYLWVCFRMERLLEAKKWKIFLKAEVFVHCMPAVMNFISILCREEVAVFDVCVDSTGAFFGALLFWGMYSCLSKRKDRKFLEWMDVDAFYKTATIKIRMK